MSLGVELFLNMLYGAEPDGFRELRAIESGSVTQRFYPLDEPHGRLLADAQELQGSADVYVGVAPRTRREGGKDAVARSHVLWADIDSAQSSERLEAFRPAPSMVVASGSGSNSHAYWSLWPPIRAEYLRQANRRLSHVLGGDDAATDAARVLRLPGSLNHKSGTPTQVRVKGGNLEVYGIEQVVEELADPEPERPHRETRSRLVEDPVRAIEPAHYVEALLGETPARDGKVTCPFHEDWVPSLHVYEDPEEGWFCFQCERGGSVYDLAAALWQMETRGEQFAELRVRVAQELLS